MNAQRSLLSLWMGVTVLATAMSVPAEAKRLNALREQAQLQKQVLAWARPVLIEFEKALTTSVKAAGFQLILRIDENSVSESARADREGSRAILTVDGGMLKSSRLTADGFRTVLCHELGHVLGGAPRRNVPPEWEGPMAPDGLSEMTSEGQADYYASAICFRRLVKGQDHRSVLAQDSGPASKTLKTRCESAHGKNTASALICERAALGGRNMLVLVKEFPIAFDTPSTFVTPSVLRDQYPDRQCRLDTFIAGALCAHESDSMALDFNNERLTECPMTEARRPSCWYPASRALAEPLL